MYSANCKGFWKKVPSQPQTEIHSTNLRPSRIHTDLGNPRPVRLGGEELEDSGVWELHAMTKDNLEKKLQLLLVPS